MQELGIPAADIKKLKEGGVNTIDNLARATKKELCAIKGLSEAKVSKLQTEGGLAECTAWGLVRLSHIIEASC